MVQLAPPADGNSDREVILGKELNPGFSDEDGVALENVFDSPPLACFP